MNMEKILSIYWVVLSFLLSEFWSYYHKDLVPVLLEYNKVFNFEKTIMKVLMKGIAFYFKFFLLIADMWKSKGLL